MNEYFLLRAWAYPGLKFFWGPNTKKFPAQRIFIYALDDTVFIWALNILMTFFFFFGFFGFSIGFWSYFDYNFLWSP